MPPIDTAPTPRLQLDAIGSLAAEIAAGGLADWRAQSIQELAKRLYPLVEMVEQTARLTADGDLVDGEEFVMENDDAWSTVNGLIHEARQLLGLPDDDQWTPVEDDES